MTDQELRLPVRSDAPETFHILSAAGEHLFNLGHSTLLSPDHAMDCLRLACIIEKKLFGDMARCNCDGQHDLKETDDD